MGHPSNSKKCVHCLAELTKKTRSKDHVFPKQWFPDTTPQNLNRWTVPACKKCNGQLGGVEKRLLTILSCCVDPTKPETAGVYQRVRRGLGIGLTEKDREKLGPEELKAREQAKKELLEEMRPLDAASPEEMASLFPGLGPWNTPQRQFMLTFREEDIRRFSEKMVRGCEFKIAKRLIEPPYTVAVFFVREDDVTQEIRKVEQLAATYDLSSSFHVKRIVAHDEPLTVYYWIKFWGVVTVRATIDCRV
ncbi:MAG: hypothetical protein WBD87_17020 [Candidatus Acidiferrales bacterium]